MPKADELLTSAQRRSPPTISEELSWPQTREGFAGLVEIFQDRIVRYAFRRLGSIQDAEDVVQEVFVRAYANRHKGQKVKHVSAYLYRMASNLCTDFQRRRKRSLDWIGQAKASDLPLEYPCDSEIAMAGEELRQLEEVLSHIPRRQAEVIRLKVFDELRIGEIAEILGRRPATVKSRLRYGLEKLRRIMRREGPR